MKKVCVIGGMNISFISRLDIPLEEANSLCGHCALRFGGVAYNIAVELAKKNNIDVELMTVLSEDFIGIEAKRELREHGIRCDNCLFTGAWQSFYNGICGSQFHYGINDMNVISLLDSGFIKSKKNEIQKADLLLVDENLDSSVLEYIAREINIPIFCDATSPVKCKRVHKFSHKFATIKFSSKEFCEFCGLQLEDLIDDNKVISAAKRIGAERVLVSLGVEGSFSYRKNNLVRYNTDSVFKSVKTLQTGGAFFAEAITSIMAGDSDNEILENASKFSAML